MSKQAKIFPLFSFDLAIGLAFECATWQSWGNICGTWFCFCPKKKAQNFSCILTTDRCHMPSELKLEYRICNCFSGFASPCIHKMTLMIAIWVRTRQTLIARSVTLKLYYFLILSTFQKLSQSRDYLCQWCLSLCLGLRCLWKKNMHNLHDKHEQITCAWMC